jgi:hypothetical protein
MSGCHVPLTMGNLAYSPGYGGYCICPCHFNSDMLYAFQCYCHCNKYRSFAGGQPSVIYLETKVMEERIKNLETRLKELEEWTRKDEDRVHQQLKDLQESYQGLSAELRHIMENIRKKPHKCPICDGLGGTKISGTIDEFCTACHGKCIVWG